jgi:hypothetical protein
MSFPHRLAAAAAVLLLTPAMATAQARLPVDVGVYAEEGQPCSSGWIWVNTGTRAGYLSFFGPNQSMGPDLTGVEAIQSTEPGRDGFTMMNGGPLEVRRSGADGVTVRAWSRANGEVGRNDFRRCAVSALHPRMQAALPQVGFSQAPRSGPGGVTASPAWRVTRVAGVPSASVTAAAGLPQLAVRCRADVAYLHLKTSAAERGRGPRRVEFVGGTTGLRRTETFQRDPETGDWSTGAGSETLALLGGRDTRVELREDGMSIGTLSLVGSTAALGQALAGCPTQGVTGGLAAAPTGGAYGGPAGDPSGALRDRGPGLRKSVRDLLFRRSALRLLRRGRRAPRRDHAGTGGPQPRRLVPARRHSGTRDLHQGAGTEPDPDDQRAADALVSGRPAAARSPRRRLEHDRL